MTDDNLILDELLSPYAARFADDLGCYLVEPDTPEALAAALRYCTDGGKRLRPALVYMTAEALGADSADNLASRAAVAVELIHCYSLVHDDLPAMDDDSLRRGRATAHVKFGSAMAILVGDALLTRAFGILADTDDPRSSALAGELARRAGPAGMIAGQAADMELCGVGIDEAGLEFIHLNKTAALIRSAVCMGAICANATGRTIAAMDTFARSLGLAFQVVDDVLDATGDANVLGKSTRKDAEAGKRTAVTQMGLAAAKNRAGELAESAVNALKPIGPQGQKLVKLTHLLTQREN